MTIAANKTITPVADHAPTSATAIDRADERRRDWRVWFVTVAIVGVMFLLLQNPYWVPGGDSEVYVAAARNIALGNGYMFNGQPAKIAPPGWPMVLAAAMKFVSPSFLLLKLITLTCMLGALATYFWVLRRFTSAVVSSAIIVLTALISHVYSLTFWLHSDALFTLITALSLLLCLQINEGKPWRWRLVALLALCCASSAVRYAGIINILIIGAALLHRHVRPQFNQAFISAALAVVVTITSFFIVRWAVNHFAPTPAEFEATAQIDPTAIINDLQMTGGGGEQPGIVTGTSGHTGYGSRIIGYGTWFSYLLWQPLRLGMGSKFVFYIATTFGWIVALIGLVAVIDEIKQKRWLLPATALYTAALCLNWPQATARYLVPITPLILLIIVRGLDVLRSRPLILARQKSRGFSIEGDSSSVPARRQAVGFAWQYRIVTLIGAVGLGSIVLCNLVLYAEEVRIMRSRNFADVYEGGLNKGLVAAADYLRSKNVGNWQTAVNPEYINIKRRMSPTGLRILTMLTGKAALQVPKVWTEAPYKPPNDRDFRKKFIAKHKVAYYLEQPRISPWRVSHYRMAWLQEWLTGEKPEEIEAGWRLYRCDGASTPVQIELPTDVEFPKRVPGM